MFQQDLPATYAHSLLSIKYSVFILPSHTVCTGQDPSSSKEEPVNNLSSRPVERDLELSTEDPTEGNQVQMHCSFRIR